MNSPMAGWRTLREPAYAISITPERGVAARLDAGTALRFVAPDRGLDVAAVLGERTTYWHVCWPALALEPSS